MDSMKGAWQGHLVETMGIIIELINTLESWVARDMTHSYLAEWVKHWSKCQNTKYQFTNDEINFS